MTDKRYYTREIRAAVKRMSPEYEDDLARILACVFAAGAAGYNLGAYIDAVMQSEIMTEFDMPMSEYHWCGAKQLAYLVEEELKETGKIPPEASEVQIKNPDGAKAIGEWGAYLYLRMHVSYGLSCSEANEIITGDDIINTWYAYHTMDLDTAIEEISGGIDISSEKFSGDCHSARLKPGGMMA